MKLRRKLVPGRAARAFLSGRYKLYFSQFGEDVAIRRFFPNDFRGTYVDIGAYDPFGFSNTALLWMQGWNGINIDANAASVARLRRHRPGDRTIHAAVVPAAGHRPGDHVGFSEAGDRLEAGGRVDAEGATRVPAITLDAVADLLGGAPVDFMNIDIEGLDEQVVADAGFARLGPRLLAIEQWGGDISEILARPATRHLLDRGYRMTGRFAITSLFARAD